MSAEEDYRYKAFISYSHRDEKWARWLHRAIETYRVPRHLVGQTTGMGTIPARTSPVFRDREELASATDLGANLNQALVGSACQIVICSTAAARSHWVNEEILAFKRLGRSDRIFCLIVDGEPYASRMPGREAEECFPPALHFQMGADGQLTEVPAEPIAADAREGKDGKTHAKIKLLAGMLGVGFDALRQRELQRRNRRLAIIAGAAVVGMVFAIGLATTAIIARNEAQVQRGRAEREAETAHQTASFLVDLFKVSDPSEARGKSITALEILQAGAGRVESELNAQPEVQAQLMDTIGTVYTGLGLYDDAQKMLEKALATRQRLTTSDPFKLARSQTHLANVLTEKAELKQAESLFGAAIAALEFSADKHGELANAIAGLAEVHFRAGRYSDAEPLLRRVLVLRRARLAANDPAIADAVEELGLNQFDQGNLQHAEARLSEALELRRKALGDAPHPDLAENLNNLALLLMEMNRFEESATLYREAMQMNQVLHGAVHPDVATGLDNLCVLYRKQGALDRAEQACHKALDMQRKLLGPEHPNVARVLINLAFIHYDQQRLESAISLQREALAMQRRILGARHPDVAKSMSTLGRWLGEGGNIAEAETLLRAALLMLSQLLGPDSTDAVTEMGLAQVLAHAGKLDEALKSAVSGELHAKAEFGDSHWIVAVAVSTRGGVLVSMGQFAEAEPLLKSGYEKMQADPGARPAYIQQARDRLIALYEAWGKDDLAQRYREPAAAP